MRFLLSGGKQFDILQQSLQRGGGEFYSGIILLHMACTFQHV
jgi:hypothetical protein